MVVNETAKGRDKKSLNSRSRTASCRRSRTMGKSHPISSLCLCLNKGILQLGMIAGCCLHYLAYINRVKKQLYSLRHASAP